MHNTTPCRVDTWKGLKFTIKTINVIFVGSFIKPKDGSVGGQLFACSSLLANSKNSHIKWCLIDSTQESNPLPPLWYRAIKSVSRFRKFIRMLIISKVDVVLIFSASGFSLYEKGIMAYISKRLYVPVVFAPRGSGVLNVTGVQRTITRTLLQKADYLMCQSRNWQAFYHDLTDISKERIVIINNWVDTELYHESNSVKQDATINVLFLGWMVRLKGIFDLLEAVKYGKDTFRNTKFIMCGGGDDLPLFKKSVHDSGLDKYFTINGWVEGKKKKQVLSEADIFVLPSYGEGMPNSVLEAMASSKAIVASRVGGIPEMITHKVDGLLYEAGDVMELFNCLKILVLDKDSRIEYGQNARQKAKKYHDVHVNSTLVFDLIKQAANSN